jgi:hypothetical protein
MSHRKIYPLRCNADHTNDENIFGSLGGQALFQQLLLLLSLFSRLTLRVTDRGEGQQFQLEGECGLGRDNGRVTLVPVCKLQKDSYWEADSPTTRIETRASMLNKYLWWECDPRLLSS